LEDQEQLEVAKQLIEDCPPKDREALLEKYDAAFIPGSGSGSANATYIRRCRTLKIIRHRAFHLGLRISETRAYPGKTRLIRRRRSRPARPSSTKRDQKHLRRAGESAILNGKQSGFAAMTDRQAIVNENNARALKALLDDLPEDLRQCVEVLSAVCEHFEREFARHVVPKPRAFVEDKSSDERPGS